MAALHTAKENMASLFATSTEAEIGRLLMNKDARNTKRSTLGSKGSLSQVPKGKKDFRNRKTRKSLHKF